MIRRAASRRQFLAGWKRQPEALIIFVMDDEPHTDPADWLEVLIQSEADIAAGRIVSGASVMRDLYASLARLEADASRDSEQAAPAPR
jgi:RNA polymerase-interacting CarD/CdnL/TRCF family regulator